MTNEPQATTFELPDLFALSSRFTLGLNPHYAEGVRASRAWLVRHGILGPKTRYVFDKADMERLAARSYPSAPLEEFSAVCDFICLNTHMVMYASVLMRDIAIPVMGTESMTLACRSFSADRRLHRSG